MERVQTSLPFQFFGLIGLLLSQQRIHILTDKVCEVIRRVTALLRCDVCQHLQRQRRRCSDTIERPLQHRTGELADRFQQLIEEHATQRLDNLLEHAGDLITNFIKDITDAIFNAISGSSERIHDGFNEHPSGDLQFLTAPHRKLRRFIREPGLHGFQDVQFQSSLEPPNQTIFLSIFAIRIFRSEDVLIESVGRRRDTNGCAHNGTTNGATNRQGASQDTHLTDQRCGDRTTGRTFEHLQNALPILQETRALSRSTGRNIRDLARDEVVGLTQECSLTCSGTGAVILTEHRVHESLILGEHRPSNTHEGRANDTTGHQHAGQ